MIILFIYYILGMTQDRLDIIFTEVRNGLIPIIQTLRNKGNK